MTTGRYVSVWVPDSSEPCKYPAQIAIKEETRRRLLATPHEFGEGFDGTINRALDALEGKCQ